MISHTGMGCEATLDVDAGTVTLKYSGRTIPRHKRDASPRVIPLGAIESVEFCETNLVRRGFVRLFLRGRSGYDDQVPQDANAYLLKVRDKDAAGFVDAIRQAAASAVPVEDYGAVGTEHEVGPNLVERMERRSAAAKQRADEVRKRSEAARALSSRTFRGISFDEKCVTYGGESFPLAGTTVVIDSGVQRSRMTATRVLGGGALLGPAGAVIGALGRKNTSSVFLTVTTGGGTVIVQEISAKEEGEARQFGALLSTAAAKAGVDPTRSDAGPSAAVPISAGPPAGWYRDPEGLEANRWWDGATWTEHVQPIDSGGRAQP